MGRVWIRRPAPDPYWARFSSIRFPIHRSAPLLGSLPPIPRSGQDARDKNEKIVDRRARAHSDFSWDSRELTRLFRKDFFGIICRDSTQS